MPAWLPGKRAEPQLPLQEAAPKRLRSAWSVGDVTQWLDSLSLGHLGERFRENGVDGSYFSELTSEDFTKELGLTPLQAKKVMARWAAEL